MGLTIDKLAIPRKQATTRRTPTYTKSYTPETMHIISGNVTLEESLTPSQDIKYYPRLYEGIPPGASPMSPIICYAEVYTNTSSTQSTRIGDLTKGRIAYSTEVVDTVDNVDVLKIRCDLPNGASFMINPGYYLGSGLYCVGIEFLKFQYRAYDNTTKDLDLTRGLAPKVRETRTVDNTNFEVAISPGTFSFSVKMTTYWQPGHRIYDERIVDNLDFDSVYGRGGLNNYYVCAGVDYKDKSAAASDPSGQWYTEDEVKKTDIDISVSWV